MNTRPELDREGLQADIYRLVEKAGGSDRLSSKVLRRFISSRIAASRRFWPDLPAGLIPVWQEADEITTLLGCLDATTGDTHLVMRTLVLGDAPIVFGEPCGDLLDVPSFAARPRDAEKYGWFLFSGESVAGKAVLAKSRKALAPRLDLVAAEDVQISIDPREIRKA